MVTFDYDTPVNNIDRLKTYADKYMEVVSEAKDNAKENVEEE